MNIGFSKFLSLFYLGIERLIVWLRALIQDRVIRVLLLIAFVLQLAVWAAAIFLVHTIGTNLAVLHYNVVFGIDQIGDASLVYITPLFSLVVFCLNTFFTAYCLIKRERNAAFIFTVLNLMISSFTLVAIYYYYLVNFS